MTSIKFMVQDYLSLRRSLGFKLIDTEYVLKKFLLYLEQEHNTHIKTEKVLQWVQASNTLSLPQRSFRFSIIRKFAQYAHALDTSHEVPQYRLLMCKSKRINPHIYSDCEILKLLEACKNLPVGNGLRRYTYFTILGLLAITGMRISEATSLKRNDVDLTTGIITIRETKFSKTRCIPVHNSTIQVLSEYIDRRNEIYPKAEIDSFFLSDPGTKLTSGVLRCMFLRISHRIGFRKPNQQHGPRIHDLRHTFVVKTIMRWYRHGDDVNQKMPFLSTYLGHVKPSDTYWYISSIPELVGLAASKLKSFQGGLK
ncbi:MAG: tyrosine-type recombinase/integrase [Spirochaetes bacterium]|nr:tyrosine-type recombinase/integrase [Spirochaetota bacterium]